MWTNLLEIDKVRNQLENDFEHDFNAKDQYIICHLKFILRVPTSITDNDHIHSHTKKCFCLFFCANDFESVNFV